MDGWMDTMTTDVLSSQVGVAMLYGNTMMGRYIGKKCQWEECESSFLFLVLVLALFFLFYI